MTEENITSDIQPNSHTSYYLLNREYFSECFDETADIQTGINAYRKVIILFVIAAGLFYLEVDAYAAWFILALAVLEIFSIRYRRAWWITRQMFSRASGSKVNLSFDDEGIKTHSPHHQQCIQWQDIIELKETSKGFVISHNNGRNYLSKSVLDEGAVALLNKKAAAIV